MAARSKTGALKPAVEAVVASQQRRIAEEAAVALTPEACEVRFTVVSQTGAIQFKTGSSVIEPTSEAILNSVADIANRCGTIKFSISGHTDNVGDLRDNMRLSLERAQAVSTYLQGKGVSPDRISTRGFGGERPIKSNETEAGHRQSTHRI